MIRYRPNISPLSCSLRNERTFDSMEDMLQYIYERWRRVVSFMGAEEPFRLDEILISDAQEDDLQIGYKNVRRICVTRMSDRHFSVPQCIGYCGE